jgi:4-diphosphocytidyl-2-C-methyl-D-erythritol kinase
MNAIHVRCPAKVNLTLEILGKRPDGYHELRTIFQAVGLYDELTVAPATQDSLTVTGLRGVPTDDRNLCLKALKLFRAQFDTAVPVAVTLHKAIPLQAGLGGGSSDAAGMLVALAAHHGVAGCLAQRDGTPHGVAGCLAQRYEAPRLADLAAQLGSDVPFFLQGGAMLGSGRGEALEPLPALGTGTFVLALPPSAAMSTAEAYTDGSHTARLAAGLRAGCALPEVAAGMYNVFAAPVERVRPELAGLQRRLLELHAQATLLCGSGAAVLGLWDEPAPAREAAEALRAAGLWAVAVPPVADGLQVTEQ